MATGTFSREPTPPPAAYDHAVEQHLRATQAQVKLVDIVSNSLLLIVGALAFTLVVAWIDHWVFALGFWSRLLALFILLGGSGWWFATRILPLIIKRINPVYAAQTIERAEPSLKNSLINFLLLRNEREKVHAVVYQAVGQRAATDLSHVPAENIVDYSHLLKIGYVLAALVVVGAIYKIVSPKDPFQSAARIVAPWADIDRPSRVSIEEVTPGDVTVFQGEQIEISANIKGAADDDVRVVFNTLDGQFIDQQSAMQPEETGLRYTATIPGDDYGAQTSLQYRIVAGDAQTRWHNVEVVPAPHILVTKVEYTPPRYTRREKYSDTRGDIEGLEGTLVTVHARANRAIESATLEFDPLPEGVTAEARASSAGESYSIRQIDGENLTTSFYLRRTADGKSAWHKQYTIRFRTSDGYRNEKPIVHSIEVKPDVAPLVEILSPEETTASVPLNRKLEIEVRAIDPDFALTNVRVVGIKGGSDLFDVTLLNSTSGHSGQVVKKFEFAPAAYGLAVDDEVEYWAIAQDNRRAAKTDTPEPNITRSTPSYRIKIIDPIAGAEPPLAEETDEGAGEGGAEAESESSSGGSPDEGNTGGGEGESPDEGDESSEESGADGMNSESSESGSGNSGSNSGQSGSESSEAGEESSKSSGGAGNESSESRSNDSQGGSEGGSSSSQNSDSASDQGGSSQQGGESSGQRDQPIENDGSRDGDIFDAINEHRKQQEQGGGDSQNSNSQDFNSGEDGGQNSEQSAGRDPAGNASNDSNSGGAQQDQNSQQDNGGSSSSSGGANQQNGNQNQSGSGEESSGGGNSKQQPQNGSSQGQENSGGASSQQQPGEENSGGSDSQQNQGGANDQQQNQDAGGSNSEGGQPQGGAKPEGEKPESGGGSEQQQNGGGMGQNDKSGAGQKTDGGGSPQSQAEDQQRNKDKSGGAQQGGQQQQDGGKSPGGSKKDSDSQGGSGGDRKGGGEQGGGQSSKQQGQDSAGSSSSGEQGDGAAQEQGAGQSGNRAGGDQIADNPTGNSGEQAGEGSNTGNASGGERNDDQPRQGDRESGDPSSSGSQAGGGSPQDPNANPQDSRGDRVTNSSGEGRGTLPTGGGKPADNHRSDIPLRDEEPGSDKANLEYARKATDMTLEYLKNQKDSPDPELLDKLGWTKEEMNSFIQRWERMKRSAKSAGDSSDEARRLDDSLRSLGLRPARGASQTSAAGGTRLSAQRDGSSRSRPPKEYADQYRAFSKFVKPADE